MTKTMHAHALPLPVELINGAPMFRLTDLLKATAHRPYFIREGLLSLSAVRQFLTRSNKPDAAGLLVRVDAWAAEVGQW